MMYKREIGASYSENVLSFVPPLKLSHYLCQDDLSGCLFFFFLFTRDLKNNES